MTERVDDFHVLTSRLRLAGELRALTGLRIGGSSGHLEAVDLPVIKDADGFPFIPGASLKGALRTTVEALVRGAENRVAGIWSCDPLADADAGPHVKKGCGNHQREQRSDIDTNNHCAVCRLFGSHVVASHARFCDAMLELSEHEREQRRIPVEVRDGVSIDRDLRRAARAVQVRFRGGIRPGRALQSRFSSKIPGRGSWACS